MTTAKLCFACFEKFFGDSRYKTVTWGADCSMCHQPTPSRALLIKCEIVPEMALRDGK